MRRATLLICMVVAASTALTGLARAADRGPYAPENIEATDKGFYWVCLIKVVCPISDKVQRLINRVVAHDRGAEYLLGLTLMVGDDLARDPEIGMIWIVRAAERGEPGAALNIAGRLRNGASIQVDETRIANALKPQVEAGDVESMRALAPMMIAGRGTPQDPKAGLAMLVQAVEKGSSDAEKDLAQLHLNGAPGLAPNRAEALRWFAVSARHGNVDAMLNLGYMSINTPFGTPSSGRNLADGYCWLMRAALLDQAQAQEKLSTMFALGEKDDRGTVIPIDLAQAAVWFRLAARSPFHNNSQIRAMIEPKMTTAQLDEVKRQVAEFKVRSVADLKTTAIALPGRAGNCPAF